MRKVVENIRKETCLSAARDTGWAEILPEVDEHYIPAPGTPIVSTEGRESSIDQMRCRRTDRLQQWNAVNRRSKRFNYSVGNIFLDHQC